MRKHQVAGCNSLITTGRGLRIKNCTQHYRVAIVISQSLTGSGSIVTNQRQAGKVRCNDHISHIAKGQCFTESAPTIRVAIAICISNITQCSILITVTPLGFADCNMSIFLDAIQYRVWFWKPIGFAYFHIAYRTTVRMENHPWIWLIAICDGAIGTNRLWLSLIKPLGSGVKHWFIRRLRFYAKTVCELLVVFPCLASFYLHIIPCPRFSMCNHPPTILVICWNYLGLRNLWIKYIYWTVRTGTGGETGTRVKKLLHTPVTRTGSMPEPRFE